MTRLRKRLWTGLLAAQLFIGIASAAEAEEPLEAGSYASPLEKLQQLVGVNDHLHTDEVRYRESDGKLFHCSYTFGVIDARDPAEMEYLAQGLRHAIPGDDRKPGCIHLAWDGDTVYTTHRGNIDNPAFLTGWDLRPDPDDPQKIDPVQLPVLQEPGVSYEGVEVANGRIYVALHQGGLGIYERSAAGFQRVGALSGLSNAWGVRIRGATAFVADSLAGLAIVDVSDAARPRLLGRVETGGQARGLALDGDLVYVAAGSAGLVVVDASDLEGPVVIGRAEMPGSAIRVDSSDGLVAVAAWNDARVYDVSDPAAPRFLGAVRGTREINYAEDGRPPVTSRTLGIAANGDSVFVGAWHVISSYRIHPDRAAPSIRLPEELNLIDFGPLSAGESETFPLTVTNEGTAPLTLVEVSTDNAAFEVEPRQARIAPGSTATLSITFTAGGEEQESGFLRIRSDDPLNPERKGYLVANRPGVGVGKPLPETTLALVDGGQWSSTDARGHVTLLAYFATF